MQHRVNLVVKSRTEWVQAVVHDFDSFLQDHVNCERKASAMAMSFVAKYPDRLEIIPDLINTAIEELQHFKEVYNIMRQRSVALPAEMGQDFYIKQLLDFCRSGRDERFMDRLLIASLVETRGAERFKLVYENLENIKLKDFYRRLWTSEAKHGEVFVRMALKYFEDRYVHERLEEMAKYEGGVISALPLKPALH